MEIIFLLVYFVFFNTQVRFKVELYCILLLSLPFFFWLNGFIYDLDVMYAFT